jgi:hypothetical protein
MRKTVRHQRGTVSAIRMESLSAIAGIRSVTMHHTASRTLVAEWHIVTCLCLTFFSSGQWQRLGTAIAKPHTVIIGCFAKMAA